MKLRRRSTSCEKGAELVEVALCLTIFLGLLFGIMNLVLVVLSYHSLTQVSREATRWAAVRGSVSCSTPQKVTKCNATASDIKDHVVNSGMLNGLATSNVTVAWCNPPVGGIADNTCAPATTNVPGNLVKVKVNYTQSLVVPLIETKSLTMQSTSKMIITQ